MEMVDALVCVEESGMDRGAPLGVEKREERVCEKGREGPSFV